MIRDLALTAGGLLAAAGILFVGGPRAIVFAGAAAVVTASVLAPPSIAFAVASAAGLVASPDPRPVVIVVLLAGLLLAIDLLDGPSPASSVAVGLGAAAVLASVVLLVGSILAATVAVLVAVALLLYAGHRYELVRLGLVSDT